MNAPSRTTPLSREEKQALLRGRLVQRISQTRTEAASFAQERLWFVEQVNGASALYNVPEALRLRGALDVAALERAVAGVVRRHEALRTTLREVDGAPVQVIAPFAGFSLPVEDLSALPAEAREAEALRLAADDAALPFHLEQGPLFRARLLRLEDDDHVLLLCMHHVVTDGWSMGVLSRDLWALYAACAAGAEPALPPLAMQYADYAAWHRRAVEGDVLEAQAAYWTRTLAGAPELLELPWDRPRPPRQAFEGAAVDLALDAGLTDALKALSQRHGTTLFMTLLAGWAVVLARLAGQDDVVIGTPSANRDRAEVEGLIGFLVNTLPLRVELSDGPTVGELLARVRARTLEAQRNQDIPFDQVVERLRPARSLAYTPLLQVMFAWQNAPGGALRLPGLTVAETGAGDGATAKFDLSLSLWERDGRIAGTLRYATALFDGATAERFAEYLRHALAGMAADDAAPVDGIVLLPAAERARVLDAWNATDAPYPAEASIHALFEAQAARTPTALAATHGTESVTYAELNARANRLARHLVRLGVRPEARVGIGLARGIEMLVAMLAVLKAGGAYVPLDPAYPTERLEFTLRDARVGVLLTQESLRGILPVPGGVRVVSVDAGTTRDAIATERAENLDVRVSPRGLAYLIYTSGSTGVPKGVAIEHESAVVLLSWAAELHSADELGGMLACTSICFDLSVYELFLPLSRGGRVIIVDNALALPGAPAADEVRLLNTVPSAAAALLKAGGIPAGVRTVNLAGEPLRTELVDALYAHGVERVIDLYGPSEDTTYSTFTLRRAGARATIGRPIANTRAYVLDARMQPVPAGVAGELYLAGRGLARGYLGRPALTAERFVVDPFASAPGGRMYRTGDRVRWTADGELEYLGRLDHQVKVRGFRIELGEIETALRRAPGMVDCAVVVREDAPGDARLVAYVVGGVDAESLRTHLRASLPEYMVPGAFVFLDALPLTPNGKLDRKALPEPDFASDADRYAAPRTPVEEVLAGLFAELLRVQRVGRDDEFFALGGHSLLATRLVARVRTVFGVELPVRDLFAGGTPARLAERVEALRRADVPPLPPIVPVERADALPLSFAQERLWFLHRMEPDSPFYNVPTALRLRGALDAAALERALGEIVRRHEALRTVFRAGDGGPVQVIVPFAGFALATEDLSALDAASREAAITRRANEDAVRPLDLAAGPLFRASLLRMADDEHVLLLCIHHVVSDEWSMGVLHRELSALYDAYRQGGESTLPEPALQYADYAVWQREQLRGEAMDRELAWWKARLSGAPALLELPVDRPRHAAPTYHGASERMELSPALVTRLQALARTEGATLYMVLMGAFQVLLGRYAASEDVVVGSPIAGRARPEVEGLIGFFVNTLVMRTDLSGDPAFREVVRRVREGTLGAFEHQDVPFERLVAELHPDRSLTHSPLFQVMFMLAGADGETAALLPGLDVAPVAAEMPVAKFDLTLSMSVEQGGGMSAAMVYATDVFDGATIRRMLGHLERVLEQVSTDADSRLSHLELLDGAERARVLDEWNHTAAVLPPASIHALFAEQAERTPDAIAIAFGDETLTYAELDARANRLAHHLVAMGMGPESRVGLCLERGPELVVALIGILKSGGAYVPLDPSYPAERLAFMQADSGISVLLTQESLRAAIPAREEVSVVSIDGAATCIAAARADDPCVETGPDGLAYVIYTSGSTGTPKGVAVEHRNVVRLVRGANYASLGADEVVLQAAPVAFDASTLELWGALLNGGRLVPMPGTTPSLEALGSAIVRHGVTTLWLTAGLFQVMVQERLEDLRGVRQLLAGGDVLPVDAVAKVRARFPGMRLINGYGPTENTTFTCCHTVDSAWSGGPVPIGSPISNTRVYVLDAALRPMPVGVPGELYAGGAGVARGYLGRPALTAERFVPDPFASVPGARMYRTGDRVRWASSGVVEYLGRLDEQVKVRGFRIELGEIESVLRRHPAVADAAVIARGGGAGDKRIIAYVVGTFAEAELRAHLKASLPDHMVPAAIVSLDALPLTPNGKMDRRALPEPELSADAEHYAAPRTPAEEVLVGLFAELLRVERVGRDDDFFALGGHSLLATRVASRIRAVFGVELPLRDLFAGGTPARLAERVDALRRADLPLLAPIVPVERGDALPLSFAQERLWFLDRMEPDSPLYNVPSAVRLSGALDAAALERALGEIVRRHEALRTVFREGDGGPVQVIAPFTGFALPVEDLSALDAALRESEVTRRASEDSARPFDLAAGPLVRATLLRIAADEHVLLICIHHIAADGWSMGVLFRELSALYDAYRQSAESPLPEPALQYADYAVWQRQQLTGAVMDAQLAWWKARLSGAPALLELPVDRPRHAAPTYHGADERIDLPAALVERLRAVARTEGATLYMVLMSAFQVLLGRYAASEDVVVGSPIAGRARPEVEGLIGFFVNTLVMRTDLSGDPAFREVVGRVREATLGAFEHQDVPFEKLVAELQPDRSLTHSPLFQVMFTLGGGDGTAEALPGLRVAPVAAEAPVAKFDLMLALSPMADGGMAAELVYATDVFDGATIRRMLGHLRRVLEQVSADADARLSRLELLDDDERAQVVDKWNRTSAPLPAASVHALFAEQAARTPDAIAIAFADESVTYRELDARANRLANHLVAMGVGPESRVGVCLERGPELVVALIGILKAGGAYVPLDPSYPAERLAFMQADSGVSVLLTQEFLRGAIPAREDVSVVSIDGAAACIAAARAVDPCVEIGPKGLAYVVYTSGSTGTPKGVAVEHRNVVRLVRGANYASLGADETVLQAAPVAFDASTLELWGALLNGGRLVPMPGTTPSLEALGSAIVRHGVTTLWLTAGLFQVMVQERLEDLRGVRQLLAGGDVLPVDAVAKVRARFPGMRLINGYGPTENTTFTCCHTVDGTWSGGPVPIGSPISNTRVYVLDAALRPMPVGVLGELYAGGAGVARGYLGRPALTAERFVPDPFASVPGARMYRTGDRVRWASSGVVEYLGRMDEQVKVRGFRIELGEIESVLRRHPAVADCAVIARGGGAGDKRVIAYVVGSVAEEELRAHLRASLPDHMVPAAIVAMDALPLTPNGKVDRKALPEPELASEERYAAPRTPVEEVLAGLFAELLRVERVGRDDDFFALGGHSLLATRVASRIRVVFGVELPLRDLFAGGTPARLAERVEALRRADVPPLAPIVPVERTGALPLSFAQERLWFLDRMEPGSPLYNVPSAMRLRGVLDTAALEQALGEIVRRHEALRTVFVERDGGPVQVIAPFAGFALPVEDLSALDAASREVEITRRASEDAARPFDLAAGPLLRASLLRTADDEHVLLICIHHIASDGWSLGVLYRELSALYGAYRRGGESSLPELSVQYADYAVWQRAQLRGEVMDRELAWWKARLSGAPAVLELPVDRPRYAAPTYHGAAERMELPAALVERLQALARTEGATLYMVLMGAFQVLLSKYAGSEDVVVGSPIAGRTRGEMEGLIGFFVNTLVMRTDLSGDPAFREVVRRARETTLGAFEHQDVPFEKLVAELQPDRSLTHSPLFQVMFSLVGDDAKAEGLPGLRVAPVAAEIPLAKFDLMLAMSPTAKGAMEADLVYATDVFDGVTVRRMLGHLRRVLEQVSDDADARLSRLELLDGPERARVLDEWNRTAAPIPAASIHALFAEQAARTPDAIAITFQDESVMYRELDARANRLAHHLVAMGVGPESRVGLCLERGPELVVALIGILKAGGAYVPLDPSYPAERLAFMQADSGVSVLLTQESLGGAIPARDGVAVVSIDGAREQIVAARADDPRVEIGPKGLAYVVYTSGSTGTPKGVAVEHRNVGRLVRGANYASLGADEVVLQAAPVAFDASTLELWGPLLNGGRLVPMPGTTPSLEALGSAIVRHGVTTLWLTAGLFQVMVQERLEDLRGVRQLLAGGDVLPVDAVAKVRARFPGMRLINGYGPTENTTFTCCHTVDDAWSGGPVPIGSPISNTRVYLLDAALRPVPIGVPGELYTGGEGVARGYLGRAALTAEKFVPDPFASVPGARMYRTGDRVRWASSGVVEYLGRLDEQVKVRGFRIELGEIESVLRIHPAVADATVIARGGGAGDKRIIAYVVGSAGEDELRAHLEASLPDHMVPAAIVALDALPLTPNGKVDRKALPEPELASEERYAAPRTPVEEVLAGLFAELLRVERVGRDDDFFALGGHSLLATRVASRIRAVFGVELPLRDLFAGGTPAQLAERVEALRRAEVPPLPPVVPVERTDALPLSFAQERLWFLDRMQPDSPLYNVPNPVRLRGALDAAALERALGEIIRRHEALRTVFRDGDGGPVQVMAPFAGFALFIHDLSALDAASRESDVARLALEDARRPFDLSTGPLLRASLLRLAADEHVLLLCIHHIASDGWSMGVLYRELSALYGAYRQGGESPLPELALQYADYAVWQREQLRGEVLEAQLAWWKARLAGAPALLELPTDHPRPAVQAYRGAAQALELSPALLERLRALGRREGATLYMVLLGAFQVLLARYSGTGDVVVGSPIAGRTRHEVEGLIGLFVNTLVMRTDLSGEPAFREVLRRVREATLGAFEHQDVPFEKLVAELRPERSLSHAPLFQVMLMLIDGAAPDKGLPGLTRTPLETGAGTTKFDLTLAFGVNDGFDAVLEYNPDLFRAETIRRMLRHLERVLEQVADDADVRLAELELLDGSERARVVKDWNRTDAAYPHRATIHGLIAEQAARTPDAAAVVFADETLTYAALDARANRLAHHLAARGAGPETFVGICLERSAEMVVAMLAVLRSGAAYLPLDPSYPADRLAYMLEDSRAPLLVTQASLRGLLPSDGLRVVLVDGDADAIAANPPHAPRTTVDAANAAYVIYTSGSTGRPKGVQVTHGNAVAFFAGMDERVGGSMPGTWLAVTRISFDIHVLELLWTLARGFRVVVQPEVEQARDGETIGEQIRRHGVTHLQCTPSLAGMLIAESGTEALAGLERILLGGEALPRELAARITAVLPDGLVNVYGPTETTVWSATHPVDDAEGVIPIGRPIANTRVYVLDAALRPQPVGVPGELLIGGAGVTRGYLGRPGLTAERFVPDPFGAPGARLYRTGDRARWTAEGVLEYLGRLDAQVKVRGFRIEPGEIESALRRHPSVRDCAVVARATGTGDTRLVAYVVGGADAETLRTHLRAGLPDYMVPSAIVPLDALPLTPNGKLDRGALPAPDFAADAAAYVAPRTPAESVLAAVWAGVLRVERVGALDNFFELGGHSLLATQVTSRIREAFGVQVPLRALFEAPTVAALADRVEALRRAGETLLPPIVPVERAGALPLSYGQERLWFLGRMEPDSASYNHPVAVRLDGALDVPALERALGEIVRRHESLRTVLPERDGAPVQVVLPFTGFALPVDDLSALEAGAREAAVARAAAASAGRVFDLAAGPLFVGRLLRLGADEHVLLLSMHHIVTDAWSTRVLFRELWALYDAFRQGRPSPLAPPAVQYADYAVWQRAQLRGTVLDRQMAYWKERMAGAPPLLALPTDQPRPALQSYRGAVEPVGIPGALVRRLEALARGEGATLYMVMLAAFQALLGRYAATDDVVVGSPVAGRTRREVEGLIGFFVNTLVLRTDLSGGPSFRQVLRRVRYVTLGAWEHQDLPFERLVEALQPERSLSYAPLFQVVFMLHMDQPEDARSELRSRPLDVTLATTKYDLTLALAAGDDGLSGGLEYASDLFRRDTVLRLLGHLGRVLEQVADDADVRLADLELLDGAERTRVVEDWNRTDAAYPHRATIHALIAEQAARTPDAAAVVFAGETLTYAALDARANRLAHHLAARGAGPETFVGICLERSAEMVVAMLAVLRSGAAYLPLDPSYPADRLAYMLEDSRAPLLVTQASLRGLLPSDGLRVVLVDGDADAIAANLPHAPRTTVDAANAAYVIYTSGSTGRPKGVQVTHGNAVAFFAGMDERVGGSLPGTWLAVTRISFDIHVLELLWTLARGFRVVVQPEVEQARDGESIGEQIRRHGVTHLQCTPSLAGMLIAESGTEALAGLERILLGGEALPRELAARITAVLPGGLVNVYGPTETTVWSATHPVDDAEGVIPIGRPIANTRVYVLDAALRPQPAGVPGELLIGGAGVTRGYLGRPGLTAERFVPDPFGAAGARLYRTGDRARWTSEGVLEYLGRLDAQVKVRGFRIEPGEIESVLRRHPSVRDCAVVARTAGTGDTRLVAYVVGSVDAEALRTHLRAGLPDYMVPSAIVPLDALPLTPNGKLDRGALPAPEYAAAAASLPPRNALERAVADAWTEVLGVAEVGVSDNFFDLGGSSLLLNRVFVRLRELRADLRMVDLFRYTTVEALAGYLGDEAAGAPGAASELADSRSRAEERRNSRRRGRG